MAGSVSLVTYPKLNLFCVGGMVVVGGWGAEFPEHTNNTKKW